MATKRPVRKSDAQPEIVPAEEKKSDAPRPRALITGAAGCVGGYLVDQMLDAGYDVTALDRPGAEIAAREGVWAVLADITSPDTAAKAVEGASVVIHAAAIVDIGGTWDQLAPVNLHATKRLYDEAAKAGARQFVFFSTGSIYAPGPAPYKEDAPAEAANDYVKTKLMAEEYLKSRAGGPVVNIIRPALIYGPRGKVLAGSLATLPALLGLAGGHSLSITGGPRSNWVHGEDVARAARFLVDHPQPHGAAFNVANDEPVAVGDVFTIGFRSGGIKLHEPTVNLPIGLLKVVVPLISRDAFFVALNTAAGALYKLALRKAGMDSPLVPRLDKEAMAFATRDVIFDNARLKKLGFTYRYPTFEEGWKHTFTWYREHKWVP